MASSPGNTESSELRAHDDDRMDGFEKASFIAIIIGFLILALLGAAIGFVRTLFGMAQDRVYSLYARHQVNKLIEELQKETAA